MRRTLPRLTDRLRIGADLDVSPFCLGTVRDADTIRIAYEAGINFFFLSTDLHWPLYEHSRRGLQTLLQKDPSIRARIVIAATSYITQPQLCTVPFDDLLASAPELGHIDIAVAGASYETDFMSRLPVYRSHRANGHLGTRAIGASFHDRPTAAIALEHDVLDVAFVRFNSEHSGALDDVFPVAARRRSSKLFVFKSIGGYVAPARIDDLGIASDNWRPEVTDHYRFVLSQPTVDGVLCAFRESGQVEALANAMEEDVLDDDEQAYMMKLSALATGRAALV
jgi:predicted aldo/keto reductase-like oxidoreductase